MLVGFFCNWDQNTLIILEFGPICGFRFPHEKLLDDEHWTLAMNKEK